MSRDTGSGPGTYILPMVVAKKYLNLLFEQHDTVAVYCYVDSLDLREFIDNRTKISDISS
jgi:hypothetical protein